MSLATVDVKSQPAGLVFPIMVRLLKSALELTSTWIAGPALLEISFVVVALPSSHASELPFTRTPGVTAFAGSMLKEIRFCDPGKKST